MATVNRFVRLNNGHVMPTVGLGTFVMGGEKLQEVVEHAISIGKICQALFPFYRPFI